jgi:hyaluronoglucosaminidase
MSGREALRTVPRRRLSGLTGIAAALLATAISASSAPAAEAGSPFAWRGVVEGQYGRPWDHGQRMRVLRFIAGHGFNAYVHAPKEDPYQRTQWRDPYPAAEQVRFDREIALARRRGVQWIPNLSPGVPLIPTPAAPSGAPSRDVCFSCPAEIGAILRKLGPFWKVGARTFMISFDDVQKVFTHPEDVAAYGSGDEAYGKANADLLNRLDAALRARDPAARLLTVGADYSGTSDTDYLRGLRASLSPRVDVMWTGVATGSTDFTADEAGAYGRWIGRKPLVWDNWTVNDLDGNIFRQTTRIYFGPYKRRPGIVRAVGGFFLNPMNEADLNLLPFATAGDWMADPASYRPRLSFRRHVREIGGEVAGTLRAFAETSYSTRLDRDAEAPTFVGRNGALLRAYQRDGSWPRPRVALDSELGRVVRARKVLGEVPRLGPVSEQAGAFLDSARKGALAGRTASDLLAAERPALEVDRAGAGFAGKAAAPDPDRAAELRSTLSDRERTMKLDLHFTYGNRGGFAFDLPQPVATPPNVMDAFVDRVQSIDSDWQPNADRAASSVSLRLEGRPVRLDPDGGFRVAPEACGDLLTAIDGAGGRTAIRLPPCRS